MNNWILFSALCCLTAAVIADRSGDAMGASLWIDWTIKALVAAFMLAVITFVCQALIALIEHWNGRR